MSLQLGISIQALIITSVKFKHSYFELSLWHLHLWHKYLLYNLFQCIKIKPPIHCKKQSETRGDKAVEEMLLPKNSE